MSNQPSGQKARLLAFPSQLMGNLGKVQREFEEYARDYFKGKPNSIAIGVFQAVYGLVTALKELRAFGEELAKFRSDATWNKAEYDAMVKELEGLRRQRASIAEAHLVSETQRSEAQAELATTRRKLFET